MLVVVRLVRGDGKFKPPTSVHSFVSLRPAKVQSWRCGPRVWLICRTCNVAWCDG